MTENAPRKAALIGLMLVACVAVGCGRDPSVQSSTVTDEAAAYWKGHPDQVVEACYVFPGTFALGPGESAESGETVHVSRENLDRNLASMSAETQQAYVDRMHQEAGSRGIPEEARTWNWQDQVEFLKWVFDQCVEKGLVEPSK